MGERQTVWEQQRDHGVEVWWEDELGKVRDTPQERGLEACMSAASSAWEGFGVYEDLLSWW